MPRKPEHETYWDKKRAASELAQIERLIREEGVQTVAGEASILRPKTARALKEIAACTTMYDFQDLCRENRAWRIRRGATCEHEL